MTKKKSPAPKTPSPRNPSQNPQTEDQPGPVSDADERAEETFYEAVASICSVLVVGLFILTFLGQNFVIPSGSMEKTLLVGDHLVVDRITLAPPASWMPLVHYREPQRGDIVVFIKPGELDADGKPIIMFLVKRLIGIPGDHLRLHDGIVYVNDVAQDQPLAEKTTRENYYEFLDEFPLVSPAMESNATSAWAEDFHRHVENGELVVPPGKFFMMGDHRHSSLDSRYWGFVPRENVVGRPLFNYWSFETPEHQFDDNQSGIGNTLAWMGHVALHFFTETRWSRTLHPVR